MQRGIAIRLTSIDEAAAVASFPVKLPIHLPDGLELVAHEHCWPPWTTQSDMDRKLHADFIESTYRTPADSWMTITQGFMSKWIGLVSNGLAPTDSSGEIEINGRSALWLTALPMSGPTVQEGRPTIPEWARGSVACVGWEDAVVAAPSGGFPDSHRYYTIASNALSLEEVIRIAESVPSEQ